MLRNWSSPLFGSFDTAVACRCDLYLMPTTRSRVWLTWFCSVRLSCRRVVTIDPPPFLKP